MRAPSTPPKTPGLLLTVASRLLLFAAVQGVLALAFLLIGARDPWTRSAAWWPLTATLTNLATLGLLVHLHHREGARFLDLFRISRDTVRRDVLLTLGVLVPAGILAAVPNLGLATLLWGDPQHALDLFIRPIHGPLAAAALLLFPVTIALAELPLYYGYALPRLKARLRSPALALVVVALAHALQHVTLPLLFDARFLTWRALMFAPFALFVAYVLDRRPQLLPYLVIVHGLLDATVAWQVYLVSTA